ncbi:hypothetical protein DMB66_47535 [Actinoplanes sp. ATCC 53533]|uniref:hypothetical protein n=1 Tax=Actinoplanes sp. ATCC 53533 TaxID=1288362 RepID=UPI000F790BA5|nr:hypothetical protein [Actinoplanes sp. ATCC 53533]RSM47788.1 hypothetical protein DMB66_47535 [Actinoplanes sp. ATCC 53533]
MSIHKIDVRDESVNSVVVGWEKAFGSFWAHVYLAGDGSGYPCPSREIGGDFREVKDPAIVIDFVRPYAHVPEDLAAILAADAETEGTCDMPAILGIQEGTSTAYDLSEAAIPF